MIELNKIFPTRVFAVTEWLYVWALLFHLAWVFWVVSSEHIVVVINLSRWLVNSYSAIGFKWSLNDGSSLIAAGMLSAVFVNVLRRLIEGVLLGWPRFNANDMSTSRVFILRSIGYGLLCFFGLGAWGANVSEKFVKLTSLVGNTVNLSVIDIVAISFGTFLIGCFVNILDDAISSLAMYIFRRS